MTLPPPAQAKHLLLIFLDGIGLGDDDPLVNPFAAAQLPTLHDLANGHRWLRDTGYQESESAVFIPTDPVLGVPGKPQSGTSQAAILTGRNVPSLVGRHFGPKPDALTRALLDEDNLFKQIIAHGKTAALINAYPPGLLRNIERGKTLPSSIQYAALSTGQPLFDDAALYRGDALSEDWTGEGWREHLNYSDTPVFTPYDAGRKMVEVSRRYDFAFFSHWLTDTIGHRGTLAEAVALLETFDAVMAGALAAWDDSEGLMVIVSDHGNLEAMDDRHHTSNPVPTVVIGAEGAQQRFADGLNDLTHLTPKTLSFLLS